MNLIIFSSRASTGMNTWTHRVFLVFAAEKDAIIGVGKSLEAYLLTFRKGFYCIT